MNHRSLLHAAAVALLSLLSGLVSAADAVHQSIDAYLNARLRESQVPGMVAAIVDHNGLRYSAAFGQQDAANQVAMRTDSIFRIASMTKPITSLAVVMLIEEKQVGLDDPIEKYLPEYASPLVINTRRIAVTRRARPCGRLPCGIC
jgi:CubicO group peptidase (beta-lactamase class C family)